MDLLSQLRAALAVIDAQAATIKSRAAAMEAKIQLLEDEVQSLQLRRSVVGGQTNTVPALAPGAFTSPVEEDAPLLILLPPRGSGVGSFKGGG